MLTKHCISFLYVAYIQEVGRAGRDGKEAVATLFFNRSDISSAVNGMTDEMRKYCDLKTCRRQYICEHFGFDYGVKSEFNHQCCDNCESKCDCNMCIILRDDMAEDENFTEASEEEEKASKNDPNGCDQSIIHNLLLSYFEAENDIIGSPNETLYTGLTCNLAKDISRSYMEFRNLSLLKQTYPNLNDQVINNINSIIKAVYQPTEPY